MNAETLEVAVLVVAFVAAMAVLLVMSSRLAAKTDELQGLLREHHKQLLVFVGHVAGLSVRHRRGRKPGTKNPPKPDGTQEKAPPIKPLGPLLAEITQLRKQEAEQAANVEPVQANRQ